MTERHPHRQPAADAATLGRLRRARAVQRHRPAVRRRADGRLVVLTGGDDDRRAFRVLGGRAPGQG